MLQMYIIREYLRASFYSR